MVNPIIAEVTLLGKTMLCWGTREHWWRELVHLYLQQNFQLVHIPEHEATNRNQFWNQTQNEDSGEFVEQ